MIANHSILALARAGHAYPSGPRGTASVVDGVRITKNRTCALARIAGGLGVGAVFFFFYLWRTPGECTLKGGYSTGSYQRGLFTSISDKRGLFKRFAVIIIIIPYLYLMDRRVCLSFDLQPRVDGD